VQVNPQFYAFRWITLLLTQAILQLPLLLRHVHDCSPVRGMCLPVTIM
jgi:hypothetical protein